MAWVKPEPVTADTLVSEREILEQSRRSSDVRIRLLEAEWLTGTHGLPGRTPGEVTQEPDSDDFYGHTSELGKAHARMVLYGRSGNDPMHVARKVLAELSPRERRELWADFAILDGRG